jgi:hypothetical protein
MSADLDDTWLTVPEAFPALRRHFRTEAALRHHLRRRELNGLTSMDAVRLSPLGKLLVNSQRLHAWVISEGTPRAA